MLTSMKYILELWFIYIPFTMKQFNLFIPFQIMTPSGNRQTVKFFLNVKTNII